MKIAILGLGTIGYGVYDILKKYHPEIEITKVLDKDQNKKDLVGNILVSSIDEIIDDKNIDVVVETMGGLDFPYQCIVKAIKAGKHVVTANKEVIATYMDVLMDLKDKYNVSLLFEASVGGGVPIIKNMFDVVASNEITSICGILNGTTNFILTRLSEGMSFDDALQLAKEKGFAEANATYDLEGLDVVRKIAILTMISSNKFVSLDDIYHYGITNCTLDDINFVTKYNYQLKYIASYKNDFISVEPMLVKEDQLFGFVKDEYNLISLDATNYGNLKFYGKGAGRYPTANAIVNDLLDILNNNYHYILNLNNKFIVKEDKNKYCFYIRFKDEDNLKEYEDIIEQKEGKQIITKPILRSRIDFSKVMFYAKTLD